LLADIENGDASDTQVGDEGRQTTKRPNDQTSKGGRER
jgi:hypothetical protein